MKFRSWSQFAVVFALWAMAAVSGCKKDGEGGTPQAQLFEEGKVTYMSRCIACHNPDPHQPGSVGPEVAGSSRELIEARVLKAQYPPGYKPKRETHLMVALPDLAPKIDALYEYLK